MEPVTVPQQVLLTNEWTNYLNNELDRWLTDWLTH